MKLILSGTEYKLTKGSRFPKSDKTPEITLVIQNPEQFDGQEEGDENLIEVIAKVTSNARWCKGKDWLEYIWIEIKGDPYYITLDYNQPAVTFEGMLIEVKEGVANRKDPVRGPQMVVEAAATEGGRIEKFKASWNANRFAKRQPDAALVMAGIESPVA